MIDLQSSDLLRLMMSNDRWKHEQIKASNHNTIVKAT